MIELKDSLEGIETYSLESDEKKNRLRCTLLELTRHHAMRCELYANILGSIGFSVNAATKLEDVPYLPVRLFKELELRSIPRDQVVKTLTSSGTSGYNVSKIFLDRESTLRQTKALFRVVSQAIGRKRLPLLIIDSPDVITNRFEFSARGAGIQGFSALATHRAFALNSDLSLNVDSIEEFLQKHHGEKVLLFGFTFVIWQFFVGELRRRQHTLDFQNAVVIHGGGWKNLTSQSVSPEIFKSHVEATTGISRVYDYYGMVEQIGAIHLGCDFGFLHTPAFADVIVRDPLTFAPLDFGQRGVLQVVSVLPTSYPGHSLLTEDEGTVFGEDDCRCGRLGKYFLVHGRLSAAEIRGCSDVIALQN